MTAEQFDRAPSVRKNVRGALDPERSFLALIALPALVVMIAVTAIPFLATIGLAFTNYDPLRGDSWSIIGLDNFTDLLNDPNIPTIIWTTLYMVTAIVIAETIVGLGLAVLLAIPMRGISIARTLFLVPVMTAGIAVAIVWKVLLNPDYGWVNYFLGLLHLPQPVWLGDPALAIPSVVIADMWTGVPFMAILLLAGLLGVPAEHKEAAVVDGASARQVFWYIEVRAIQPILIIAILFRTMDSFRKFEGVQALTGGGPGLASQVANLEIYQRAFVYDQTGSAAALSVVMAIIIIIVIGLMYWTLRRLSR